MEKNWVLLRFYALPSGTHPATRRPTSEMVEFVF